MTCLGVSTDTDTGIQVTASGAPPHPRPYCRGRVWRSFDTDLGPRVFEAPFVSLGKIHIICVSGQQFGLRQLKTLWSFNISRRTSWISTMNISIVIRLKITNIRQAKTSKAQRKRFLTPTVKSSCLSASEWCDAPTAPRYNWSGRVGWGGQTDGHLHITSTIRSPISYALMQ